jgi:hypothetical protein
MNVDVDANSELRSCTYVTRREILKVDVIKSYAGFA